EGLQALPTQWSFAEEAASKHDQKVDRRNWRVVMAWHLAESKKQAEQEAVDGLQHWHNEYNVRVLGRPGSIHVADKWELLARVTGIGNAVGTSVIGTPDEMVKTIRALQEVTGGFALSAYPRRPHIASPGLKRSHNWTSARSRPAPSSRALRLRADAQHHRRANLMRTSCVARTIIDKLPPHRVGQGRGMNRGGAEACRSAPSRYHGDGARA
ncbi:hypothetical protein SAMN02990966_07950, partial [Rhodospirillales bacterium URHD0017]